MRSRGRTLILISPALACAALAIEALVGYPEPLFRAVGHPVSWMGWLLGLLDRRLNRDGAEPKLRRRAGVQALALLLGCTLVVTLLLTFLMPGDVVGFVLLAVATASLPAQRSLYSHVETVADALEWHGLEAGRRAVSLVVGRNPETLDEAAVARAAVESLAENFSDGVVAPAVWIVIGGLPGGALYKAVNTADSMIGHRTPRYASFGWAAARLDDLANWPAARLATLWLIIAALATGADWREALHAVRRDARRHRSPNAGWPEAAMAGALGLQLGGPRSYGDVPIDAAFMGDGRAAVTVADIRRALGLYRVACQVQGGALALMVFLVAIVG